MSNNLTYRGLDRIQENLRKFINFFTLSPKLTRVISSFWERLENYNL